MYVCDFHTHTLISQDSQSPLPAMLAAAHGAGIQELCVTDHCDLLDGDGAPTCHFPWQQAKQQHQTYAHQAGFPVRLGLELGSIPYDPQGARAILAQGGQELDFVLGSLHNWIGAYGNQDFHFTRFGGNQALGREAVENSLTHTLTMVTQCADCYDALAHIIYPLRYIQRDGDSLTLEPYRELVMEIFRHVAATGHALEVNTCRGKSLEEWLPLLRWFRSCGGEYVTIGSDAHVPQHVGLGLTRALELLETAGFSYVTTYQSRRPVPHKL